MLVTSKPSGMSTAQPAPLRWQLLPNQVEFYIAWVGSSTF